MNFNIDSSCGTNQGTKGYGLLDSIVMKSEESDARSGCFVLSVGLVGEGKKASVKMGQSQSSAKKWSTAESG